MATRVLPGPIRGLQEPVGHRFSLQGARATPDKLRADTAIRLHLGCERAAPGWLSRAVLHFIHLPSATFPFVLRRWIDPVTMYQHAARVLQVQHCNFSQGLQACSFSCPAWRLGVEAAAEARRSPPLVDRSLGG
jgi:hypothetical protein